MNVKEKLSKLSLRLAQLEGEYSDFRRVVDRDLDFERSYFEYGPIEPLGNGVFGVCRIRYSYSPSLGIYIWVSSNYYRLCVSELNREQRDEFDVLYNSWAFNPSRFGELREFIIRNGAYRRQTSDYYRVFECSDFSWPSDRRKVCRPNFAEYLVYRRIDSAL